MGMPAHTPLSDAPAMPLRARGTRGFTLIELCVVIAICSMIASMLLPAVQYSRATARRIQCCSNLHQLGVALATYVDLQGNFGRFPNCARQPSVNPSKLPALPTTLARWTESNAGMFYCPADLVYFPTEGKAEWQRLNPGASAPSDTSIYLNYGVSYEYMYSSLCSTVAPFTPGTRQQIVAKYAQQQARSNSKSSSSQSTGNNSSTILVAADFPLLVTIDISDLQDADATQDQTLNQGGALVPAPMQVHGEFGQDGSKNGLYLDGHVDSKYSNEVGVD